MLDVCYKTSCSISVKFNVAKCHLMVLGPLAGKPCPPLSLGGESLTWVQFIKYLGVHIISARRLTVDINPIKRAFFVACNTICCQSFGMDDILQLSLLESYCLPILTYAVSLKTRQMAELNACWNSAFRKSFVFHRWESVRQFIHGLGRLDLIHIFMLRKSKFMCKTYRGSDTLMHNLLWCYIPSSGIDDRLCSFVFSGYYSAVKHKLMVRDFAASCNW